MPRPLVILRPEGQIPGLLAVNSFLAENFGCVVAMVHEDGIYVGTQLREATIVDDQIIPGDLIVPQAVDAG